MGQCGAVADVVSAYDATFAGIVDPYPSRVPSVARAMCGALFAARRERLDQLGSLATVLGVRLDFSFDSVRRLRDELCAAIHVSVEGRGLDPDEGLPTQWAAITVDFALYWGEVERRHCPSLWWSFFTGKPVLAERCLPCLYGVPDLPERVYVPVFFVALNLIAKGGFRGREVSQWRSELEREEGDGEASYAAIVRSDWLNYVAPDAQHAARVLAGLPKPGPALGGESEVDSDGPDERVEQLYRGQQDQGVAAQLFWVAAPNIDAARREIDASDEGDGDGEVRAELVNALRELLAQWPPVLESAQVESPYDFVPVYDGGTVLRVDLSGSAPPEMMFDMDQLAARYGLVLCYWNDGQYDPFE